ncbi:hypothetical protein TNCV_3509291 [Trichonephila clavipes]|nr:hypothetical protein TNCV_3509291 [Trichonephila clavipes]
MKISNSTKISSGNEQSTEYTSQSLRSFCIFDCPTASSEEFLAVHEDIMYYTAPMMADKDICEFVQSSKNIIDADSDDENEINNADPLFTSSVIMKSIAVI